jgi:hypothetical protein
MKKNDIAAVVVIVAIAAVFSYFIANAVIGKPNNNPVQVEQVSPIGPTFATPDSRVFNEKSVDPTVEINGDGQSTDRPFTN